MFGDGLGHRTRVWNIVATRYVTVRGCWRDQRGGFAAETRRALTRRANASENRGPGIKQAFDPRMIAVASVTVMGSFMSILDTTMVNVAVPTFVRSFRTSLSNVQWVTTGYILALAVVIPLTRWAADRFGTKRVWLVSVLLFTLGSLLCGLSWSLPTLIASRVIQGLGGGMILPTGQTILAREAGPHRLGRVMTVVGVPQFLAPLLGPVAGGLVLSTVSWRWIFFINLPIGVIALIRGRRILEAGELGTPERIDFLGMALLSPGFALLIYGIAEFGNVGAITSLVASTFLGGLSLLGLFAAHALRVERPLLDLRLWKNKSLAAATSVLFIFSSGLQAAVFSVQLYYQIGRGYSPLHAALLLAPGARRHGRLAICGNANGPSRCARRRPNRTHDYRVIGPAVHPDHTEVEPPRVVGILVNTRHGPRGDGDTDERSDVRDPRAKSDSGRHHDQQHRDARWQLFRRRDRRGDPPAQDLRLVPRWKCRGAHQALAGSSSGRRDDPLERLPRGVLVHRRARLVSDHSGAKAPEASGHR